MTEQQARLGVDIGGTFTDVVLEANGSSYSTKVLTTYAAPEDAIIDGMHQVCQSRHRRICHRSSDPWHDFSHQCVD